MENLLSVSFQVGVLFALMGVGAISRYCRLLDEAAVKGIVNILIIVVTPCLIVDVFQRPFDSSMLKGFLGAAAIVFVAHAALVAFSRLIPCRDPSALPVLRLAVVFSNAGFMGIPLENAILGSTGIFYGIVYVVVFNIYIWSWGLFTMKGAREGEALFPKSFVSLLKSPIVANPGTIGVAIALPLFFCSIRLPAVFSVGVNLIASLNTPLAMIVIGFYLARADFSRVIRNPLAYIASFARLVAFPLAMIAFLLPLRAFFPRELLLALVIAACAPVAAMVSMFAAKFDRDIDLSVGLVSATTLLSIFTMPPIIALAMELF